MSEEIVGKSLNPWWRIWVQPRKTIREIIDTDPKQNFLALVLFYGFIRMIAAAVSGSLGDTFTPQEIAILILIGGPLAGYISIYLTAWLLEMIGKMLGGQATGEHLRSLLAWASIPMSVMSFIGLVPMFAMFGNKVFTLSDPGPQAILSGSGFAASFLGTGLVAWQSVFNLIGSIYYFVIVVIGLSETQQFSMWKAFGSFAFVSSSILMFALLLALLVSAA